MFNTSISLIKRNIKGTVQRNFNSFFDTWIGLGLKMNCFEDYCLPAVKEKNPFGKIILCGNIFEIY
jgi:hypothetical protein